MTLPEYLASNLQRKFVWGEWDCVLAAVGWLNMSTGRDWLAGIPKWTSEKEARRVMRDMGGLESALDARMRRTNPNLARDGDVTIYNRAMCLFSGPHIVGPNEAGLQFIDRTFAQCAWHF